MMKKIMIIHPEGNLNNNPNLTGIVEILCEQSYLVDIYSPRSGSFSQIAPCDGARIILNDFPEHLDFSAVIPVAHFENADSLSQYVISTLPTYDLIIGVDRGIIEAGIIAGLQKIPYGLISYEILFTEETGAEFKKLDVRFSRDIAFAVCQDRVRSHHLSVEYDIPAEKILDIPVAGRGVRRGEKSYLLHDALGLDRSKKIALYIGCVNSSWAGINELLESTDSWDDSWVLVLHHRYAEYGHDFISKIISMRNVFLSPFKEVALDDLHLLLNAADLGIGFYIPQFQTNYFSDRNNLKYIGMASGKIATYLQHGIPIVVNNIGEMSEHVAASKLGIVAEPIEMMSALLAATSRSALDQQKANCFRFFKEKLDLNKTIAPLLDVVVRTIGGGSCTEASATVPTLIPPRPNGIPNSIGFSCPLVVAANLVPFSDPGQLDRQDMCVYSLTTIPGAELVRLNICYPDEVLCPDGWEVTPTLTRSADQELGTMGKRKPFVVDLFNTAAEWAHHHGIEWFALTNSDIVFTQYLVREINLAIAADLDAIAVSRNEVAGIDAAGNLLAGELVINGYDVFFCRTEWWRSHRQLFQPYIFGERAWDNAYAAIMASNSRFRILCTDGLCFHFPHATDWLNPGPYSDHNLAIYLGVDRPNQERYSSFIKQVSAIPRNKLTGKLITDLLRRHFPQTPESSGTHIMERHSSSRHPNLDSAVPPLFIYPSEPIRGSISLNSFKDFTFAKRHHFSAFNDYALDLFHSEIDPDDCDLKVYQDLLVFAFIRNNIPIGSKILDIGGGASRILAYFSNEYECWNLDKLEGAGNGPLVIDNNGYRLVRDYIGNFCTELPEEYFDFVFSISCLEHVPDGEPRHRELHKNICIDIDRVLKPGGISLHCFDITISTIKKSWTNDLAPFMNEFFSREEHRGSLQEAANMPDLYTMSERYFNTHWRKHPAVDWDFAEGKPSSWNVIWQKPLIPREGSGIGWDTVRKYRTATDPRAPKLTVVTPSFNQAEYLEECIQSVLGQHYPNLEYIVMDGGSNDGSEYIIQRYSHVLSYWQSQPDNGQYTAIHDGFLRSSGQIMTWINSDDRFHSGAFEKVAAIFSKRPDIEWITCRPNSIDEHGKQLEVRVDLPQWSQEKYLKKQYKDPYIQQEGTFWRRTLWDKAGGGLRLDLKLAGDLELWARFFRYAKLHITGDLLAAFRVHPDQKTANFLQQYWLEAESVLDREIELYSRPHGAEQQPAVDQNRYDFLVSAIVSTYKSEKFIQGCLEDLTAQTLFRSGRLEIVIVNSASPQNEDSIIQPFLLKYPQQIKYIRTDERETIYKAWNRGIEASSGKYLTNANTDDRHRSDALEIMATELETNPEHVLVYTDQLYTTVPNDTFGATATTKLRVWAEYSYQTLRSHCMVSSQPMWRRSMHDLYGYFDDSYTSAGDWEFWLRIGKKESFKKIRKVLGLYYENPEGVENSNPLSEPEAIKVRQIYGIAPHEQFYSAFAVYSRDRYSAQSAEDKPRVSVVLPCYNYGQYLKDAVGSVLTQTYQDFEIIIINDGSTDNSREVAEQLIAHFPQYRIRLINQPNSGHPAHTRNRGIREALGDYILPLDADDMIAPTMIEECLNFLEHNPAIAFAYTDRLDFDGVDQVVHAGEYDFDRLKYQNHLSYCALIRRTVWEDVGGYRKVGYEDWDFWVAAGTNGYFGRRIPLPLFMYRRHDTGRFQEDSRNAEELLARIMVNNSTCYSREEIMAAKRLLGEEDKNCGDACPLVSVIVPTYNRPGMLGDTLQSILNQSYHNIEIIVVNDAGADVEGIVNHHNSDRRISYARHASNRGLGAARNTGIKLARGKYIAYLDDDDLFYPDHVATLVNALEGSDCKVAYTDAHRAHQVLDNGRYVVVGRDVPYSHDFNYDAILINNFVPVLCFMHEKKCLDSSGLFDESLTTHEDWDLWIRMSRSFRFDHIKKVTCEFTWRQDGSTMTSSRKDDFMRTTRIIYDKYRQFSADKPALLELQRKILSDGESSETNNRQEKSLQQTDQLQHGATATSGQAAKLLTEVDQLVKADRLEEAEKCYRRLLMVEPDNVQALVGVGVLRHLSGKHSEAAISFQKVLKSAPDHTKALCGLGMVRSAQGRYEEGLKLFGAALDSEPDNPTALHELLKAAYSMGRLSEAEPYLVSYLKYHPGDIHILFSLAGLRYRIGDLDGAGEALETVLTFEPGYKGGAELADQINRTRAGQHSVTVTPAPDNPAATAALLCEQGNLCAGEGKTDEAADFYHQALAADPGNSTAFVGIGVLKLLEGKNPEAAMAFSNAHKASPDNIKAICGLGLAYSAMGKQKEAFEQFRAALAIDPEDLTALHELLKVSYELDRLDEAEPVLQNYLRYHPADCHMLFSLAGLRYRLGRYTESLDSLEQLLVLNPDYEGAADLVQQINTMVTGSADEQQLAAVT